MNRFYIYLITIVLFASCKGGNKEQLQLHDSLKTSKKLFDVDFAKQQVDTVLLSKNDTAFVLKNKLVADDIGDKYKDYIIKVYFKNKKWPVLIFKNAIGADLAIIDDLNGDGQPEILLKPDWFSSCWASVNLFSLKNNTWKLIKSGSMYFCSDQYPLDKRVVKTENGYGLLTDSLTEDKFITLKKTIKF
jgi:hypothetical protein